MPPADRAAPAGATAGAAGVAFSRPLPPPAGCGQPPSSPEAPGSAGGRCSPRDPLPGGCRGPSAEQLLPAVPGHVPAPPGCRNPGFRPKPARARRGVARLSRKRASRAGVGRCISASAAGGSGARPARVPSRRRCRVVPRYFRGAAGAALPRRQPKPRLGGEGCFHGELGGVLIPAWQSSGASKGLFSSAWGPFKIFYYYF